MDDVVLRTLFVMEAPSDGVVVVAGGLLVGGGFEATGGLLVGGGAFAAGGFCTGPWLNGGPLTGGGVNPTRFGLAGRGSALRLAISGSVSVEFGRLRRTSSSLPSPGAGATPV